MRKVIGITMLVVGGIIGLMSFMRAMAVPTYEQYWPNFRAYSVTPLIAASLVASIGTVIFILGVVVLKWPKWVNYNQ